MFSLGYIYYYDKVIRDVQKAHYWIEKAIQLLEVETEYPPATHPYKYLKSPYQLLKDARAILGEMYYHGDGVEKDYVKAVNLFNHGISDNANAMYLLSKCYRFGRGVEKDIKKAEELEKRAATYGNEDAKDILEIIQLMQYKWEDFMTSILS